MVNGLLGKKVGMTQLLENDGTVVPVTVIQAGPCVVVQKKTMQKDGYDAVQLGFVEFVKPKSVNKPMTGHFKKSNVAPVKFVREMVVQGEDGANPGDKVMVDIFNKNELVPCNARIHVPSRCRLDRIVGLSLARFERNAHGGTSGQFTGNGAEPPRRTHRSGKQSSLCVRGSTRTCRRLYHRGEIGAVKDNGNSRYQEP